MPVRSGMSDIILKVRALIGDKNAPQIFTDQDIQDQLDTVREVVRYAPLRPVLTPSPNTGVIQYLDFFAPPGYWESDTALFGPAWQPLFPATSDFITGHWTFAVSQVPTVWLVGNIYDVYNAAATLLEEMIAQDVVNLFDVKTGERQYYRSQIRVARMQLAESYRAKAWAQTATMVRNDGYPYYYNAPVVGSSIY